MLDKTLAVLDRNPKIMLALSGAAVALISLEFVTVARICVKSFRAAHAAEFADDVARAASEALGG